MSSWEGDGKILDIFHVVLFDIPDPSCRRTRQGQWCFWSRAVVFLEQAVPCLTTVYRFRWCDTAGKGMHCTGPPMGHINMTSLEYSPTLEQIFPKR
jgi:hypothetical protein